jgi:REP-associated tyrosine transposase
VPRPLRPQFEGAIYHATARGNRRGVILADGADCDRYLSIFAETVERYRWRCAAFCLMRTHYHLLLQTPEPNIARGMQFLNGLYAQTFNKRHEYSGHVFQGRYHTQLIETEAHLLAAARYIALNPVRARACERPEDWQWSSYAAVAGLWPGPRFLDAEWLLESFSDSPGRARELFRRFVVAELDTTAIAVR